ncbi:MAG TPA: orotate phosphoribosyltransferase [Thermoanaerobaculia bacterium]
MTSGPTQLAAAALDRLREAATLLLWRYGAVQVRPDDPFHLASGNASPLYVNCRRTISEPAFMAVFVAAARLIWERAVIDADAVAGGETAGVPYAAYLAAALSRPLVYVRKKPKGYGTGARLEGHLEPGSRVLLVEDLITDGGSKLGFLDALAEAGATVRHALVLFDRQQGGEATLAARGVELLSVTDLETTLRAGEEAGLLTAEARRSVDAYLRDPAAWHGERGLAFVS